MMCEAHRCYKEAEWLIEYEGMYYLDVVCNTHYLVLVEAALDNGLGYSSTQLAQWHPAKDDDGEG